MLDPLRNKTFDLNSPKTVPVVPIVVMSGHDDESLAMAGVQAGARRE